ncbi:hypothetical protein OAF34_06155 [Pirellulaceae bacterium]|jgi:hypothetical protein|nr:hypothetical protein [Pirellulaceae bacterium]
MDSQPMNTAAKPSSMRSLIGIVVLLVILIGAGIYFVSGRGGGATGRAFMELRKAFINKDFQTVYAMIDVQGQGSLDGLGESNAELADLSGADRYAKYMEGVAESTGSTRVAKMVLEWMDTVKVQSAKTEDKMVTLTLVYGDKNDEKLVANQVDDQYRFQLKPSSNRFFSALTANYAGESGRNHSDAVTPGATGGRFPGNPDGKGPGKSPEAPTGR